MSDNLPPGSPEWQRQTPLGRAQAGDDCNCKWPDDPPDRACYPWCASQAGAAFFEETPA
jgi:hypothetical protein